MRPLEIQALSLFRLSRTSSGQGADALLARVRRRDAAALAEVYDHHNQSIRAFARRLIGSDDEAEDLVHEAFMALPDALESFEGKSSLRTFLMSIAANHARHHIRAATRRRAALGRFALEPSSQPRSPEREASDRELAAALTRALDSLPIDQRIAFVLCEVEGRSSAEAAEIASVPDATLRTRLFHARRKLREALAEEGYR